MSRPRFLADEDLSGNIVRAVRRMEPQVEIVNVVEQGLSSSTDEEVLEFAWQHQWLIVSHDVNTMTAAAQQRINGDAGLHGLFLVVQGQPIRDVAECLVLIHEASEFEEWLNLIVYLPF